MRPGHLFFDNPVSLEFARHSFPWKILVRVASTVSNLPCLGCLGLPSLVHGLGAPGLTAFQHDLILPVWHVDRVDESTGLDAESCPCPSCGSVCRRGLVDVLARVKLERGFGAEDVEVDFGLWMRHADQRFQWSLSSVQGQIFGVGVHDETVVDVWFLWTQHKRSLRLDAWKVSNGPQRDIGVVYG